MGRARRGAREKENGLNRRVIQEDGPPASCGETLDQRGFPGLAQYVSHSLACQDDQVILDSRVGAEQQQCLDVELFDFFQGAICLFSERLNDVKMLRL